MYKVKSSEKFVIAIFIALNVWITNVYAQNDCTPFGSDIPIIAIEIIPGVMLESPYEIDMSNTIDYIISHTETPTTVGNYFEFDFNNDKLLVMTKPSFLNYEKEQNSTTVETVITLDCSSGRLENNKLYLTIQFQAVNHFAPVFSEDRYDIEILTPLPIGINIFALISERISAIDYDLHYNQITFTSDITNQPFRVGTASEKGTMGKEFFANIFTTEKIINIRDGIEFKITATDAGGIEKLSSTVDVKLTAHYEEDVILQVPIFTESLYIGTLDFTKTPPLDIETISLVTETFTGSITFDTELSDGDYIQLTRNGLDNAIEMSVQDAVTEDVFSGRTRLSFIVTATQMDGITGRTAVLIDVVPRKSLVFDNDLYTGTIKSDMTIDHDLIKLTDATYQLDVEFSIKDDPLGWFDVIFSPNVNQMAVQLKPTISNDDLNVETLISLTISAISASNTLLRGESQVVLVIKRTDVTATQPPPEATDESDNIGFIVGIIVLAVLLLLAFIAIFGMWWRWIRPYRYMQRDSSKDQLHDDFNDNTGYTEPIAVPSVNTSDTDIFGKSANFEIKNENDVPIEAATELLKTSPESLDNSLHSILDMDERTVNLVLDKETLPVDSESDEIPKTPPKTRKKSIKFNELVERIDILDDINDKD